MKKLFLLWLALIICLVSCGDKDWELKVSGILDGREFIATSGFAREHSTGLITLNFADYQAECTGGQGVPSAGSRMVTVLLGREYQKEGSYRLNEVQWWDPEVGASAIIWKPSSERSTIPVTFVAESGWIRIDKIDITQADCISGKVLLQYRDGEVTGAFSIPICRYSL